MSPLIWQPVFHKNPIAPRSWRERGRFVMVAFVRGAMTFGGKLAAISGFVGGSVLTYAVFVGHLALPWILLIALAIVGVVFGLGAYNLWDHADRAARLYYPSWEQVQAYAHRIQALTGEYTGEHEGKPRSTVELDETRRTQFRARYAAGLRMQARIEYDRASSAGFRPDFPAEKLSSLEIEDAITLADALEEAATRWREAEWGPSDD